MPLKMIHGSFVAPNTTNSVKPSSPTLITRYDTERALLTKDVDDMKVKESIKKSESMQVITDFQDD